MQCAVIFSELSTCTKRKVGAYIVRDNVPIAHGYNGTPSKDDNCCEEREYPIRNPWEAGLYGYPLKDEEGNWYRLKTKDNVIHAEDNALRKLVRSNESGVGASLFVTTAPCVQCASRIIDARLSSVYYLDEYKNEEGIKYLRDHGILVIKLEL